MGCCCCFQSSSNHGCFAVGKVSVPGVLPESYLFYWPDMICVQLWLLNLLLFIGRSTTWGVYGCPLFPGWHSCCMAPHICLLNIPSLPSLYLPFIWRHFPCYISLFINKLLHCASYIFLVHNKYSAMNELLFVGVSLQVWCQNLISHSRCGPKNKAESDPHTSFSVKKTYFHYPLVTSFLHSWQIRLYCYLNNTFLLCLLYHILSHIFL